MTDLSPDHSHDYLEAFLVSPNPLPEKADLTDLVAYLHSTVMSYQVGLLEWNAGHIDQAVRLLVTTFNDTHLTIDDLTHTLADALAERMTGLTEFPLNPDELARQALLDAFGGPPVT
jgi:hypothetical protein